ncbi:MAG: S-methyl-5-thioribose-1-phosphate isomerase [Candidatus Marinimicrobia bacterium]|nr:S-methyl-5-thioribose-1-phosphate isomerase [Candidatus Neomarinimicrobiota bacterium]
MKQTQIEPLIDLTPTITWTDGRVKMIDQARLPLEEVYIVTDDYRVVMDAIYRLSIRGAPAIGVAGAYASVLASYEITSKDREDFLAQFYSYADELSATRPTAVNLTWAVGKMKKLAASHPGNVVEIKQALLELAHEIRNDDINRCHALALHGADLISNNSEVMTICNTGGLATSGIGTALGVIQYAHASGKSLKVHVCETRPLLQGSRLNTWELKRTGTPFTLLTDSMAAQTMNNTSISAVFVGADRIASNGDTANKIGTYSLAVLANYHKVPFYVAAPLSTVDYAIKSGEEIPVESRSPREVTRIKNIQFTGEDIEVSTPAFDVTPANLVTGIITEQGIAHYPYSKSLKEQRDGKHN